MLIRCGKCGATSPAAPVHEFATYRCGACGAENEVDNVPLQEWLGFRYKDYLAAILRAAKREKFKFLAGKTPEEVARGKLDEAQVNALRGVMHDGFKEGQSIRQIRNNIRDKVKVPSLETENGQVIPAAMRELTIARTETTRIAAKGASNFYKDAGVEQYRWLAAASDRTCEDCADLNGRIFDVGEGELPPLHVYCRCTVTPVTRLDHND